MYFVIFNFLFSTITSYVQQNLIISLQEANKHKSNFLSKVSHEIRYLSKLIVMVSFHVVQDRLNLMKCDDHMTEYLLYFSVHLWQELLEQSTY